MFISGLGLIYSKGRGISTLISDLENGPSEPEFITVSMVKDPFPVFRIASQCLGDRILPRAMRRADRFSRIVTLAALDSIEQSGRSLSDPSRTGILFATSLGPHTTSFDFLEEILAYGDTGSSPTKFTHSVHNLAVSYIAQALHITGPTSTIAQFNNSFIQVLLLAQAWLNNGRCDQVLVGAGEEFGNVLAYILSRKLIISRMGQIDPFENNGYIPGEGAVFFLLSKSPNTDQDLMIDVESWTDKTDLYLVNAEQISQGDRDVLPALCYAPIFGHTFSSIAFHAAIAAATIQKQKIYQGLRFGSPAMQKQNIVKQSLNAIACREYPNHDNQQIIVRKQK
ncbi:MAG: beta-ketoacyl synthase chain length factor [Sedimentisphaerales bacterium]|nr:beta-ketoacyl synthase chain length factor [Sedimentisphaerales bacterium]